jgi:hypothetical protein
MEYTMDASHTSPIVYNSAISPDSRFSASNPHQAGNHTVSQLCAASFSKKHTGTTFIFIHKEGRVYPKITLEAANTAPFPILPPAFA